MNTGPVCGWAKRTVGNVTTALCPRPSKIATVEVERLARTGLLYVATTVVMPHQEIAPKNGVQFCSAVHEDTTQPRVDSTQSALPPS